MLLEADEDCASELEDAKGGVDFDQTGVRNRMGQRKIIRFKISHNQREISKEKNKTHHAV